VDGRALVGFQRAGALAQGRELDAVLADHDEAVFGQVGEGGAELLAHLAPQGLVDRLAVLDSALGKLP